MKTEASSREREAKVVEASAAIDLLFKADGALS
jgi:hypothetical protein